MQFLVASATGKFKGLRTNELFDNDEPSKDILNRMLANSPVKIDGTSSFANQNMSNAGSTGGGLTPLRSAKGKDHSGDLTFKLTSVSTASPQKGRNMARHVSLSSKQIREASRRDLKAAKHNAAIAQLIRNKHRKTQSYSTIQANANLRKQKLDAFNQITADIKKGKLPPVKSPKALENFVFGDPEKGPSPIGI